MRERVRVPTRDEVEKLVTYYQDGESTYALARRFGINRRTVSEHLRRSGKLPGLDTERLV